MILFAAGDVLMLTTVRGMKFGILNGPFWFSAAAAAADKVLC